MTVSQVENEDPSPSLAVRLRSAAAGGACGGLVAGLIDGGLRSLGIDPSVFYYQIGALGLVRAFEENLPRAADLLGQLGCWALTGGIGFVVGGLMGLLPGLLPMGVRRVRSLAGGLVLGAWLGVALFWWTRPFVLSGVEMSDPRRLAAGAGLLLGGLLAGLMLAAACRRLPAGLRKSALPGGLMLTLIGAGYLTLGNNSSAARGTLSARNRDLPNVVVIVVDALRQDALGCYGNERITTPNIDALAAEGVVFEEAFVQAPFTWPSFGCLLTGKYPRRHGLVQMDPGLRMGLNVTLPFYLSGAKRKDGTALEDGDYATAAFMTGTISHGSGLLRGFDYYYEAIVGHDLVDVRDRWSRFRSSLLPALILNKLTQRFDDGVVASVARKWMSARTDQRFMSLVHLYSTHTTYAPAERFLEPYGDADYDGPVKSFSSAHVEAIQEGQYNTTPEDVQQVRDLYAGGVSQADAHIGAVVDSLREAGVLDNTIIVVTSDHGESLGEDGYWEHNWMLQSNLRIPLIMRFPPGLPMGERVSARVDSIDLVPTILDLMGLEALLSADDLPESLDVRSPAGMLEAQEAVDGMSLVPLVDGAVNEVRPYSFAENGGFLSVCDGRWMLVVTRDLLAEDGPKDDAEA
ncbi:MAG: arylsulfatase A-like enzyme, partial [Planctomycetota bacterium]